MPVINVFTNRGLTCGLHEAVKNSTYRTLDPEQADYFWRASSKPRVSNSECASVPPRQLTPDLSRGNAPPRIPHAMPFLNETQLRRMFAWIAGAHPYWNRSVAEGVARHLMVFSCDDGAGMGNSQALPSRHEDAADGSSSRYAATPKSVPLC